MASEKKAVEERKEAIKKWFKDPYMLGFIAIIAIAFIIRFYYFTKTLNQAVWWDEGEYMLRVKHLVLNTPQSGFFQGRELFTPYFWAVIYYFFHSETAIRFIQVIISTLTVGATYYLGKEVYNKKIGLLASAFMTFFWLHLFFTDRLLTYLYAPLFYTLALGLFWAGYAKNYEKKDRYLLWFFVTLMIGVGIYYSIAFSALTVILYLLFTERLSFVKNKRLWKYLLITLPLLLLSFIPSYIVQGSIIPRLSQVGTIQATETGAGIAGLLTYINMMPRLLLPVYLWIAIISLYLLVKLVLFFDIEIIKSGEMNESKKDLFVFLGVLVPLSLYTWLSMTAGGAAGANYDAWIIPVFPALFCFMSKAVFEIRDWASGMLKGNMKTILTIIIAIVLIWGFYGHITFADESIKAKESSFYNLKPAGEWLKEHSAKEDKIYSAAVPELTYYSEREILGHDDPMVNKSEEGFIKFINLEKPKYLVLTVWEYSPAYVMNPIQNGRFNLTVANAYFINMDGQKNPDIVIYEAHY